jgi:hypothetical protein
MCHGRPPNRTARFHRPNRATRQTTRLSLAQPYPTDVRRQMTRQQALPRPHDRTQYAPNHHHQQPLLDAASPHRLTNSGLISATKRPATPPRRDPKGRLTASDIVYAAAFFELHVAGAKFVTLPVPSGHRITQATAFSSQGAGVKDS